MRALDWKHYAYKIYVVKSLSQNEDIELLDWTLIFPVVGSTNCKGTFFDDTTNEGVVAGLDNTGHVLIHLFGVVIDSSGPPSIS